MIQYKVLVADDDPPSRQILIHFMQLLPELLVVGEAKDGKELLELAIEKKPDLILVDISMPYMNGIEAVKACKKHLPHVQIIFTTGHDEFAVTAFNIEAVDYIVKPIERTRLFIALDKAKKAIQMQKQVSSHAKGSKLVLKSHNTFFYIPLEDILYIEKEGRKTVVHTAKERFETTEILYELESKLPDYFFKTHRSYLVNLKKINSIKASGETFLAVFSDCHKLAHISKLKINEVQELIGH
jgi:two-component system, LytTR family, response regulator